MLRMVLDSLQKLSPSRLATAQGDVRMVHGQPSPGTGARADIAKAISVLERGDKVCGSRAVKISGESVTLFLRWL